MARISSTTLFNFTDSLDHLKDNLTRGIYCCNTYEALPKRNTGYSVPMTCFCDIPLSSIKEHFEWYGRYGIGIKRQFARSLGVKPVWYVTSGDPFVKELVQKQILSEYEKRHLLPYLKKFMGNQHFTNNTIKRKKFYDEREWRFIPDGVSAEPLFKSNDHTHLIEPYCKQRMKIDPDAVEYVIIKDESEYSDMFKLFKQIAPRTVASEIWASKLLNSRQIEKDF
jgi:hypothetical protein